MERLSTLSRIEVVQGDITREDTDAIVNAANPTLHGGGGVDGAIHRAAGPGLLKECRTLKGCPTGEARMTAGYRLKARHVIHTVGPIYQGRDSDAHVLASCYRWCMELAGNAGLSSIAFPSVSTGAYGYPIALACPVALAAVVAQLERFPGITLVRFVLFHAADLQVYQDCLARMKPTPPGGGQPG